MLRLFSLCCCVVAWLVPSFGKATEMSRPPNVLFIMCDDLGVGELGCYSQQHIRTPRLDALATQGMRFTQHNSGFPVCAPARCSLMTGRHAGHCEIRNNGNPPVRESQPEAGLFPGQFPISDDAVTIAEQFQQRGYATGAMGKWGLGFEGSSGDPSRQGFDLFFGYICQVHAHNHFPRFLWTITPEKREQIRYAGNTRELDGEVYSQDEFVREAKRFITNHREQPFFLYLPLIVSHLSIQVPEDEPSLADYRRTLPEDHYRHTAYLKHPTPRAGYAAMVTRMDRGVGELLDLVESYGLTENTIVVFTSDNGPTYDRLGGSDSEFFNSAMGLRGRKGSMYEGGLRVPLVVSWPGHIPAGSTSDLPTYFADWMPTLQALTGGAATISPDLDGLDFSPILLGNSASQASRQLQYWEFPAYGGQQAIRVGDWKAIRTNLSRLKPGESPVTELYNLAEDPTEVTDVAAQNPQVVIRLERLMTEEHTPSAQFPLTGLDPRKPRKQ